MQEFLSVLTILAGGLPSEPVIQEREGNHSASDDLVSEVTYAVPTFSYTLERSYKVSTHSQREDNQAPSLQDGVPNSNMYFKTTAPETNFPSNAF